MILCFQYENEAKAIYQELEKRLNKLGLEFAKDKTRLIEFGRFAEENRKRKGQGKPETFDFLGFTHYCSKSNGGKFFRVKRKTSRKKLKQKVKSMKFWLKENRNKSLKEIMPTLKKKLIGHYNYYGITDNSKMLEVFVNLTLGMLYKWLNRRSQRTSYTSQGFNEMLKVFQIPRPKIKVNIYA